MKIKEVLQTIEEKENTVTSATILEKEWQQCTMMTEKSQYLE